MKAISTLMMLSFGSTSTQNDVLCDHYVTNGGNYYYRQQALQFIGTLEKRRRILSSSPTLIPTMTTTFLSGEYDRDIFLFTQGYEEDKIVGAVFDDVTYILFLEGS